MGLKYPVECKNNRNLRIQNAGTQKSLYALRAIFELAKCSKQGPMRIADIAKAQAIPRRLLETILTQLKQAGFVESCRGNDGGYVLIPSPGKITVG